MNTSCRHQQATPRSYSPVQALAFVLLFLYAVPNANAQGVDDYVRWSATSAVTDSGARRNVELTLRASIADAWKMYAMDSPRPSRGVDITIKSVPADVELVGSFRQADPRQAFDPNFQIDVTYFVETAEFVVDLDVARGVELEENALDVDVLFQICNDDLGICLPPTTRPLSIGLDGTLTSAVPDCLAGGDEATATEDCEVGDLALAFAPGGDASALPRNTDDGVIPPGYADS
ncbi:MAG: hypothetical protein HKN13_03835, partial [Rhodothermales bacterium]|nr:hypothetical protein [Rhodothermales bacterium]